MKRICIILAAVCAVSSCMLTGCGSDDSSQTVNIKVGNDTSKTVDGSGSMAEKEFSVSDGTVYELDADMITSVNTKFNIIIDPQKPSGCRLSADDNIIDDFKFDVSGNTIKISADDDTEYKDAKITLELGGTVTSINAKGSYTIDYKVPDNSEKVDITMFGACTMNAEGKCTDLNVDISGSCDLEAFKLISENADVDVSGSSKANIYASEKLKADVSGTSTLIYDGDPSDIEEDVSSMCTFEKK